VQSRGSIVNPIQVSDFYDIDFVPLLAELARPVLIGFVGDVAVSVGVDVEDGTRTDRGGGLGDGIWFLTDGTGDGMY